MGYERLQAVVVHCDQPGCQETWTAFAPEDGERPEPFRVRFDAQRFNGWRTEWENETVVDYCGKHAGLGSTP